MLSFCVFKNINDQDTIKENKLFINDRVLKMRLTFLGNNKEIR